jgi:Conjugative transposon protein TcpC
MRRGPADPQVMVSTRRLWEIRLVRELPRYLLCAASIAGLAASVRFAIAPPRPVMLAPASRIALQQDPAAEGFAVLFARRYLTWNAAEPLAVERALQPFVGSGMEPAAGLQLPRSGSQRVEWAEVVQRRESAPGEHVYSLAVQTDTGGLLYLTVTVGRAGGGGLALAGYPAFVGSPAFGPAASVARLRELADPALATVVERALRNYLAAAGGELAADLTSGARISLPSPALALRSVQRMAWSPDGRSVVALVLASDARGVQYTLAYELDVVREGGRWEISAVQMDPNA